MDNFDFDKLITQANGMLPASVYSEISKIASTSKSDVLEIGTAHGASAIAAAIGLNPKYSVKTVDKLQGGSRSSYGGIQDNESIVRRHIKDFGMEDRIELYIGASDEVADQIQIEKGIGMLVLDADGAVDRDFQLYYDKVLPGAPIVIDDYRPEYVTISRSINGRCNIGQKHRLTCMLVDHFETAGLLVREKLLGDTYIGRKPVSAPAKISIDVEEILKIYRKLTFVKGKSKTKVITNTLASLKRRAPAVHLALKKVFRPHRT